MSELSARTPAIQKPAGLSLINLRSLTMMAVMGLGFTSCGDDAQPPKSADKTKPPPDKAAQGTAMTAAQRMRMRSQMRHQLSDYSQNAGDPAEKAKAQKRLAAASELHKQRVAQMMAKYRAAGSSKEAALDMLAEAGGLDSEAILTVTGELLAHADPEVRGRALAAVEGFSNEEMLPLIQRSLSDPDMNVRLQGAQNLGGIRAPEVVPAVGTAFQDKDQNVRQTGFQAALNQEPALRNKLLAEALGSPYSDLSLAAIMASQGIHDADMVPLWIQGLGHADATIRDQANDALSLTFHQSFPNAAAATAWWSAHRGDYDFNLVLSDAAARRLSGK